MVIVGELLERGSRLMQLLRLPLSVTSGECRQGRRGSSGGETPIPPGKDGPAWLASPGSPLLFSNTERREQAWLRRPREAMGGPRFFGFPGQRTGLSGASLCVDPIASTFSTTTL